MSSESILMSSRTLMSTKSSWHIRPLRDPVHVVQPPGYALFKLFLPQLKCVRQRSLVLPLETCSRWLGIAKIALSWLVFGLLAAMLGIDIMDIAGGGYLRTPYGKINPIISLVSFCTSQITFFSGCSAAFFLIVKRNDIIQSAVLLESLVETSHDGNMMEMNCRLKRLRWYNFVVVSLGLTQFVAVFFDPMFFSLFWSSIPYAWFNTSAGFALLFFRGVGFVCIFLNYTVKGLFAYFNCVLHSCAEVHFAENAHVLAVLEHGDAHFMSDPYVDTLKRMLRQNEKINAAFDQLQKTFSVKLLLDVTGNLVALCNETAWLSIWFLDASPPDVGFGIDVSSLPRHVLLASIDVWCVWIVLRQPIRLFIMHQQGTELVERIIFARQVSQPQEAQEPCMAEGMLTTTLIDKIKSNTMLFSAGGAVELGPVTVTTILAGMAAFVMFVLERAGSFQKDLQLKAG